MVVVVLVVVQDVEKREKCVSYGCFAFLFWWGRYST